MMPSQTIRKKWNRQSCCAVGFFVFLVSFFPHLLFSSCGETRMSPEQVKYEIVDGKAGGLKVRFMNAQTNIVSLDPAPEKIEAILNRDTWLILVVPNYRTDRLRMGIVAGIGCMEKFQRKVKFGVRLFGTYEELRTWFPDYLDRGERRVPIWIVRQNGRFCDYKVGIYSDDELVKIVTMAIHSPR